MARDKDNAAEEPDASDTSSDDDDQHMDRRGLEDIVARRVSPRKKAPVQYSQQPKQTPSIAVTATANTPKEATPMLSTVMTTPKRARKSLKLDDDDEVVDATPSKSLFEGARTLYEIILELLISIRLWRPGTPHAEAVPQQCAQQEPRNR